MERLFIDSTIVRAHQHSAAAKKRSIQKIGRSRFGLTTKLDVALDLSLIHISEPTRPY